MRKLLELVPAATMDLIARDYIRQKIPVGGLWCREVGKVVIKHRPEWFFAEWSHYPHLIDIYQRQLRPTQAYVLADVFVEYARTAYPRLHAIAEKGWGRASNTNNIFAYQSGPLREGKPFVVTSPTLVTFNGAVAALEDHYLLEGVKLEEEHPLELSIARAIDAQTREQCGALTEEYNSQVSTYVRNVLTDVKQLFDTHVPERAMIEHAYEIAKHRNGDWHREYTQQYQTCRAAA